MKKIFVFILGSAPDGFDLSEVIINGILHSLKEVINHDLDIMYVYKACVVGENKQDNTPMLRSEIPEFPGFCFVSKVGKIENENLDLLFEKFVGGDGHIVSRHLLEEILRNVLSSSDIRRNEKLNAKILCFEQCSANLEMENVLCEAIGSICSHDNEDVKPLLTGPSLCVPGGFEFVDATLFSSLKAIKETKYESSGNSFSKEEESFGKKYAPRYKSFDMVTALPLSSWPVEASEFFTRERKSGSPNASVLEELKNSDCYLVCKGNPLCKDTDKMFRLSFSEAELIISRNVSDSFRICYRWAKLLLKMHLSSPKVLSSYHVKTMLFWYLEEVTEADILMNAAKYFVGFLDRFIDCCDKHDIPNYFYPKINMVNHLQPSEMESFIGRLKKIRSDLPFYLKATISSKKIKPCGNKQAVNHISDMITNSNRKGFSTEFQYWKYVFLTLHGHKFTDEEIDDLIKVFSEFVDNKEHSHRKHMVEIKKKLAYGEFEKEKQFWSYVHSKGIGFSDDVLEGLAKFMQDYAKLNPNILSDDPEWFEKDFILYQ